MKFAHRLFFVVYSYFRDYELAYNDVPVNTRIFAGPKLPVRVSMHLNMDYTST